MSKKLLFSDCAIDDKYIYFVGFNHNMLYKYDFINDVLVELGRIPEEPIWIENLCAKILIKDKCLFIVPAVAMNNYVWIYDIEQGSWNRVYVEINTQYPFEKFVDAIICNNELILVSCYSAEVFHINIETYAVEKIGIDKIDNRQMFSLSHCCVHGDILCIPSPTKNEVILYSILDRKFELKKVGSNNDSFSGILFHDGYYWLAPYKNTGFIKWNGDRLFETIQLPDELLVDEDYLFDGIIYADNTLFLLGLETKATCRYLLDKSCFGASEKAFCCYKCIDGGFVKLDYEGNLSININGNVIERKLLTSFQNVMKNVIEEDYDNVSKLESKFWGLQEFLKFI